MLFHGLTSHASLLSRSTWALRSFQISIEGCLLRTRNPDCAEFTLGRTEGATRGLHAGYACQIGRNGTVILSTSPARSSQGRRAWLVGSPVDVIDLAAGHDGRVLHLEFGGRDRRDGPLLIRSQLVRKRAGLELHRDDFRTFIDGVCAV